MHLRRATEIIFTMSLLSNSCLQLSTTTARCVPMMGFGPSPKELSNDPPIPEVIALMKADRALRDLQAAARGKLSEGFVPGGNALMRELPGKGPWGYFDPIGITPECQREALLWREAEIMHGRVAMVAALGFFVQEALFHPLIPDVPDNLAINQLKDTPMPLAVLLVGSIFFTEITRARKGWVEPDFSSRTAQANTVRVLREGYEPGDLGFDPLKMKSEEMQEKELNNGRLAMIAAAGFVGQELATGAPVFAF